MSSSNLERKARRRQQTRLTFEPLNSSPVQANMSPAHVRYEPVGKRSTPSSSLREAPDDEDEDTDDEVLGSAAKHKQGLKLDMMVGSGIRKRNIAKTLFKTLPKPTKSSQANRDLSTETLQNDSDSESDIQAPRSTRKVPGLLSAEKEKHTAGLDGAGDSSDEALPKDMQLTPSKKKAKHTEPAGKKTRKPEVISLDSDSDLETYKPQPRRSRGEASRGESSRNATRTTPVKKSIAPKTAKSSKPIELSDSEDELQLPQLKKGKARPKPKAAARPRRSRKPQFIEIEGGIEDEDDDDDNPIVSSPKRSQRPLHKPANVNSDSEEEVRSSPARRRNVRKVLEDDEDEDEDEPVVSPLKRSRPVVESDDSDEIVASPLKRRRPERKPESDSDDFPSVAELSRSKNMGKGKERARSPSTPPETLMRTRQATARRHRTAKEKQMELLRRRRAGEAIEELTESESEEDANDDDEFQKLDQFEDDEESPEQQKKSSKSRPKVRRQRGDSSDEEAGESDFVIEDNDGPLGVPTDYDHLMPLQFTQAAHKPIKEHFRDVVEWMVQKKLNPAFNWDDPVYNQAFQKLDNEYLSFADSKFVSTQWTADFTRTVYARPTILITKLAPGEGINILGEAKCEPCNHRNHQPSFAIQFTGKAYHKATLEEIESESEDEDDESDDSDLEKASVNSKGQELPSVDKIWMSGSVCKQNAEQAHTLIHWRWHLNDWVISNLEDQGYLSPAKLAAREKLSTKKRMKLANAVVDSWNEDKIIKNLYHDFKSQLEMARELKAQARGGWK